MLRRTPPARPAAACSPDAYVSIRQHTLAYVSECPAGSRAHAADQMCRMVAYLGTSRHALKEAISPPSERDWAILQLQPPTSACRPTLSYKHESTPHTSAYVSIRQHTSAYVSIRQHTLARRMHMSAYVRRPTESYEYECTPHASAYVSIRQLARCIRQHTPAGQKCRMSMNAHCPQAAYVSIRQHSSAYVCV